MEVLECEGGSAGLRLRDEHLGEEVEALNDTATFPPTLTPEQLPTHTAVVRLLSAELSTTGEVSVLDRRDVRERNDDRGDRLRLEEDPIERSFVGVEGEYRAGIVGLRRVRLEHEYGTVGVEPKLLDPTGGENGAVPVGESEVEAGPLAIPKREAKVAGLRVEVERRVVGDEEGGSDVGNVGAGPFSEAPTVAGVERESGRHRGAGVGAVDAKLAGESLGELIEGALGGESFLESFPDTPVDHESEVGEEGEDRRRERHREIADEAPADRHGRREARSGSSVWAAR